MDTFLRLLNTTSFVSLEHYHIIFAPPAKVVEEAYETLPLSSPMIVWIEDILGYLFNKELRHGRKFPHDYDACPKEMFISLLTKTDSCGCNFPPMHLCDYHEHDEETKGDTASA